MGTTLFMRRSSFYRLRFDQVAVLLNNAGIAAIGRSYEGLDTWKAVMDVNLFGYVFFRFRFVRYGTR